MKTKHIQDYEQKQMNDRKITDFSPGDNVTVKIKVTEGDRTRLQAFEGVVIAKRNRGLNSSFTVRKISYGEGIERVLPYYSPQINKIEVVKKGDVRRSKLYYLRSRSGKSARITEKASFTNSDNLKKNNTEVGIKKTAEVSEKNLKNEETSLKDSIKKKEEKLKCIWSYVY